MNIPEYISSGVVELYAAGALSAEENSEFESLLQTHPEIKDELDLVNTTLNRYAETHAVTPPSYLKAKILQAALAPQAGQHLDSETRTIPFIAAEPNTYIPAADVDTATIRSINSTPAAPATEHTNYKWLMAAAVSLFLISNVFSFYFYNKWKSTEERLQVAQASQQQYAQNYERVQQRLNTQGQALTLLSDAATRRVPLKGVTKSPESEVTVFWHSKTQKVLVEVNNLPAAPDGYQYQLWALDDGKPVDAGLLTVAGDSLELQPMKAIAEAQAFAITLEPKGGSINPTLDQMYVMGEI